MALNASQSR